MESWWVALVLFVIAALYVQGVAKKERAIDRLSSRLASVDASYASALREKKNLVEEIASQSDPEWVEMVLMRKLGVVPEGQTKVHFR